MDSSESPYGWTPQEVEAAFAAYNAAPENATKAELRAIMDAARAEVQAQACLHNRMVANSGDRQYRCADCGTPLWEPACQHRHIDNETAQCKACGEQMVTQHVEPETILSAPNAAACTNPACLQALADGTYDETNPPAGCTNPHGFYVEDRSQAKLITIGWKITYECERCGNDGTLITSEGTQWDCGRWHTGDYISAREKAKA